MSLQNKSGVDNNSPQSTSSSPRTSLCWRASQSLPPRSLHRPGRWSRNWLENAAAWSAEWKSLPRGFQIQSAQLQRWTLCTGWGGDLVSRGFSHRNCSGAHSRAAQLQQKETHCSWFSDLIPGNLSPSVAQDVIPAFKVLKKKINTIC